MTAHGPGGGGEAVISRRGNDDRNATTPTPLGGPVTSTLHGSTRATTLTILAPPEDALRPVPGNNREQVEANHVTSAAVASQSSVAAQAVTHSATEIENGTSTEYVREAHGSALKYNTYPPGLQPNAAYIRFIKYDTSTLSGSSRHSGRQTAHLRDTPVWIGILSITCFLAGVFIATLITYAVYNRKWHGWWCFHSTGTCYIDDDNDRQHGNSRRPDLRLPLLASDRPPATNPLLCDMLAPLLLDIPNDDSSHLYRNGTQSLWQTVGFFPRTSLSYGSSSSASSSYSCSASSCGSASTCSTLVSTNDQWDIPGDRGLPYPLDDAIPLHIALHQPLADQLIYHVEVDNAGFDFKSEKT